MTFVDSSAFIAQLDHDEANHPNVFCFDPHFAEQGFNILKP